MAKRRNRSILEEYDALLPLYSVFCGKLEALIDDLLQANGLRVHSISSRIKGRESLTRKLSKSSKSYSELSGVTDIAGVRIITYLADDVDRIASLIEREFAVDSVNSVDKRVVLDPDRFGYLSLHHVVSLSAERSRLTEYQRFQDLKAELQTRSILQHAWAEIEHDLGYKSTLSVPKEIRRRFSRLAGLLELADQEFVGIKGELAQYESSLEARIAETPQEIELNAASLRSYARTSAVVGRIDMAVAEFGKAPIDPDLTDEPGDDDVDRLTRIGITSIQELDRLVQARERDIREFAKLWLAGSIKNEGVFAPGVSLFYLWYVLLAESGDKSSITDTLRHHYPKSSDHRTWSSRILRTRDKAKAADIPPLR